MMDLQLKIYNCLCETEVFTINGIDASLEDFGSKADESPETAEEYGCGDMRFTPKLPDGSVLAKYGITMSEYEEIAVRLENGLSFGNCGWCI